MSNERKLLKEALNFINFVSTTDGSGLALRIKEELDKTEIEPDFYISRSSISSISNGIRYWCDCVIFKNKPSKPDQTYIPVYLSPQTQNLELSIAVKAMRDQALYNENWYTFIPCEFSENVDTALNNITVE